jgi:Zn-dependent protease with chaperone function
MIGQGQLAADVVLFLLETTFQSAALGLLVFLAVRVFHIQHPALRANLWLMVVVCPAVAPLVFHILLPRSGVRPGLKLLEGLLAAPVAWLEAHELLAALTIGAILAVLFGLDVLRWLVAGMRTGAASGRDGVGLRQAHRCTALLPTICQRLGVSWSPAVAAHDAASVGVYVLRWPRPCIHLPVGLLERLDAAELAAVLAHEVAHLRRRDWLRLLAMQLCCDLTFFNPLAHLAYGQFMRATEEAADDAAAPSLVERLTLAASLVKVQAHIQTAHAPVGLDLAHRPTDTVRRARRLLCSEAAEPCPAAHLLLGWAVLAVALLLAGVI